MADGRSADAPARGNRLARRRRLGSQRAQPGAVGRMAGRQLESSLHQPGLHRPRVRGVSCLWRRHVAGADRATRVGPFAIACLAAGLGAAGGRRAALIGASLLATNYVFVMWNRAALMESTMSAFIVDGMGRVCGRRAPAEMGRRRRCSGACSRGSPKPRRRSFWPRWS